MPKIHPTHPRPEHVEQEFEALWREIEGLRSRIGGLTAVAPFRAPAAPFTNPDMEDAAVIALMLT